MIIQVQGPSWRKDKIIKIEAQWEEDNWEHKHEVEGIADASNVIEQTAERDSQVSIKVGQHIIKSWLTK